ncbi:hypothetical protein TNIN_223221 [Trichonephila inaurata madagascariensis]|uniref:Uncharacterized protein n=1 Tax=Trichonephila inaurata madagascariensis TaxID=2747483 RepID=A0A8X6YC18_9ARAC|nr:hypothetical protein TNIN_223221 [Trichonephila inaurata madagascariensis]
MSLATAAKSFLIRPQRSTRSRGNGGTKTLSLIKPQKKASCPVTSGAISNNAFVVGDVHSDTFHVLWEKRAQTENKNASWFGAPITILCKVKRGILQKGYLVARKLHGMFGGDEMENPQICFVTKVL